MTIEEYYQRRREPKKLSDLYGHDLAGWQITQGHFLELDHKLWGTFPALGPNEDVIVTLDKKLLKKVWENIERRPAKVTSIAVIANPAKGIAFSLDSDQKGEVESIRILSAQEIEQFCEIDGGLHWTFGLLTLHDRPVNDPVFE